MGKRSSKKGASSKMKKYSAACRYMLSVTCDDEDDYIPSGDIMHTTMVPVQVKTLKIQAGVQVSRQEELKRHLQLWKCFGRLFLFDLNIVSKLGEFESFSDHTEETRSGSTTTHANYSLPEYESFHFDNPSLPRPPPEPSDVCLDILYNDESFEPGEGENIVVSNVEEDDSFTFTIRTFLPFLTYPGVSPLSCSTGSEDLIFDPGIITFRLKPVVRINQKSQENRLKRARTDTRIRRVQKEAKDSKPKPEKSNPQSNLVKVVAPSHPDVPILIAGSSNQPSLRRMTSQARLVLNYVGLYRLHGDPVVDTRVEAGCDYLDICGEPEFMERMEAVYYDKAVEMGSLVILACGFNSFPAELGLMFNSMQWVSPVVPNRVEAYVQLESSKRIVGNFATYESAVLGLANAT
ncbi:hypothetical protein Tco_1338808 [Tanacetum coccineum]